MSDRPFVSLDPTMQSGAPCVNGTRMTVAALVSFVWIGKADEIPLAYPGFGVPEVQVACWYAATHGRKKYRLAWAVWAREYADGLAADSLPFRRTETP